MPLALGARPLGVHVVREGLDGVAVRAAHGLPVGAAVVDGAVRVVLDRVVGAQAVAAVVPVVAVVLVVAVVAVVVLGLLAGLVCVVRAELEGVGLAVVGAEGNGRVAGHNRRQDGRVGDDGVAGLRRGGSGRGHGVSGWLVA